jgi:hypothetical protein
MSRFLQWIDFRNVLFDNLWGLAAIVVFTAVMHLLFLKLERETLMRLVKGGIMVLVGLMLFLQGVNVGLVPAGTLLAEHMGARLELRWMLVPLSFLLGLVVTRAEPGVRILCTQVERATTGSITEGLLLHGISLGVALFTAVGMARILLGFPLIYLLAPGYLLAMVMMLRATPIFIGIAFDASTVATGPVVITFVSALAIGLATVMEHRDPLLDGFGLIAVIALAPVLSVLFVGVLHRSFST